MTASAQTNAGVDKTVGGKTNKDEAGNITIPLSDPAQPAIVRVRLVSGSIKVTVGSGPEVVVAADSLMKPGVSRTSGEPPGGMHRVDPAALGFKAEEAHNVVTIGAGAGGQSVNLQIQVPLNASLDAQTSNGSITLINISGPVSARTMNGSVTVSLDHPLPDKPMSLRSLNGKIDVTLPADTGALLRLKATNGAIYSDFDMQTEPDGARSINGGGPEYSFQTTGTILIHSHPK